MTSTVPNRGITRTYKQVGVSCFTQEASGWGLIVSCSLIVSSIIWFKPLIENGSYQGNFSNIPNILSRILGSCSDHHSTAVSRQCQEFYNLSSWRENSRYECRGSHHFCMFAYLKGRWRFLHPWILSSYHRGSCFSRTNFGLVDKSVFLRLVPIHENRPCLFPSLPSPILTVPPFSYWAKSNGRTFIHTKSSALFSGFWYSRCLTAWTNTLWWSHS